MGIKRVLQAYEAETISTQELVHALQRLVNVPLSEGQRGLWALYKAEPAAYAYNVPICVSCPQALDLERLQAAYRHVLAEHGGLAVRVVEEDGQAMLACLPSEAFAVAAMDLGPLAQRDLVAALLQRTRIPFVLEQGPLIRLEVLRSGGDSIVLTIAHHIVLDGSSSRLLLERLLDCYRALCEGRAPAPQPPQASYADFVAWEQQLLAGEQGRLARDYWQRQLAGVAPLAGMPVLRPWTAAMGHQGEVHSRRLSAARAAAVEQWVLEHGASKGAFFLAVFKLLLLRYSGQRDLVVGMPVMNRPQERFDAVIGHFINMLPIRSTIDEDEPFAAYVRRLQGILFGAIDHAAYPFSRQVRDLGAADRSGSSPVFQVSYNYQGWSGAQADPAQAGGAPLFQPVHGVYQAGEYELGLDVLPDDGVILNFKYHPELYAGAGIANMADHYLNLLDAVLAADAGTMAACALLGGEERSALLEFGNQTEAAYPAALRCDQLFAAHVAARPDAPAASYGNETLSYTQLDARSTQLAGLLQQAGLRPHARVGVCAERSLDLLAGLLAVMKSGAAYVPLDPAGPQARLAHMVQDSGCQMILTQRPLAAALGAAAPSAELVFFDAAGPAQAPAAPCVAPPAGELAYIMYTSGSTGMPKGVMVPHRALTNFLCAMQHSFAFSERERLLAVTTYCFDIAALELYLPLISGAHCIIGSADVSRDAALLVQEIARVRPTFMQATPVTWSMLFRAGWRNAERTRILCGGEAMPGKLKQLFLEHGCDAWNMYGPTETTIWSSMHHVSADTPLSIGTPIANTRMYVLDQRLEPVPFDVVGELCIAGDGVAAGYCNKPELSAQRFIDSPFRAGERIYRTGDLACRRAHGEIELLGRGDNQIKLRGYRMELGEIETALNTHPGIDSGAVVVHGTGESARLCAYVMERPGAAHAAEPHALRAHLALSLPDYMIPAEFVRLDAFPLTPNGKVDRKALAGRAPAGQAEPVQAEPVQAPAPQPDAQLGQQIQRIFAEVLQHANFGPHDRYFDIGGDSFNAIAAVEKINARLGCRIGVTSLFKHPTVAGLAALVQTQRGAARQQAAALPPASGRDAAPADQHADAVAIVGISCVFPDADTHRQFWSNLVSGKDSMRFVPEDALRAAGVPEAILANRNFVPQQAGISGKAEFDPSFFNISPRDAELMDPQGRLLLQQAWKAVEDAGYAADDIPNTSVFMSAANNFYQTMLPGLLESAVPNRIMHSATEYVAWVLAQGGSIPTMISNKLGLTGPSIYVSSNCSSSLVGLHQACQGLLVGDVDQALVGAATIFPGAGAGYVHQPGLNLSSDGRCKAFDAGADGMVGGEGGAVVMLKRARDAVADGDHIYALIRGIAVNNDGADKAGFYAPSVQGQTAVIRKVIDKTGIDPATIRYVEAHGTGTRIGDPIELAALTEAYRHYTARRQYCAIGSVKSNIGHLDAAAGMAGLVKLALSLQHGEIPQTLHYSAPNPEIDFAASPFYVAQRHERLADGAEPLRAALSCFGLGGTNAHAILEQYRPQPAGAPAAGAPFLVLLSAQNAARLKDSAEALLDFLPGYRRGAGALADLAYTTQVGRQAMTSRLALLADDMDGLERALSAFAAGGTLPPACYSGETQAASAAGAAPLAADASCRMPGRLQQLAQAWAGGATVAWRDCYGADRPRRVSLPTYVFAKKRYWIAPRVEAPAAIAPTGTDRIGVRMQAQAAAALARIAPGGDPARMLDNHARQAAALDRILARLLLLQLRALGLFDIPETEASLAARLGAGQQHLSWLACSVRILCAQGLLVRDGERIALGGGASAATHGWQAWEEWKGGDGLQPAVRGRVPLLEAMLKAMPDILGGQVPATQVMFPGSSLELVEGVYKHNPVADYFNATLADAVSAWAAQQRRERPDEPLRVLEIGAGTGSSSEHVFRRLAQDGLAVAEYCYTDLSKAFLTRAERRYGATVPYLQYRLFDVEQPLAAQGYAPQQYDIVIATNVLHATRNVGDALANAKALLRLDGVMLINEITENDLTMHLTFGLLEGWWRFEDGARRLPGGPALSGAGWRGALEQAGFHTVCALAPDAQPLGLQVLAALSDGQPQAQGLAAAQRSAAPYPAPASAPAAGAAQLVETAIVNTLSAALKLEIAEIRKEVAFSDYGLDSLTGVDLVEQLRQQLGIDLAVTSLFDYPTVIQLTQYILADFGAALKLQGEAPQAAAAATEQPAPPAPATQPLGAADKEAIAIIGMSGRFPQCDDTEAFWQHLARGDDLVEPVTRWDLGQAPGICRDGGFLRDIAHFDPLFFNISGLEASYMEPQQRIFLEEAWRALEDAGYAGVGMDQQRCGVYVGCTSGDYLDLGGPDAYPAQAFWGNMSSIVPARISYYLNLHGPALAVDTACSSSLVAVHLACQSLWSGETSMAIAGGVFVQCTPRLYLAGTRAGMLSPSGRCRAFDDGADGFVPAEGVGVLVLKRLSQALADGDHIHGVVRGSGLNQDGTTNGITAPSANSQQRLEQQVYQEFGIDCEHIQMMEAHGTGTRLGDPIEFQALARAFGSQTSRQHYCALGSSKANIGHAQMAAGVIGIIKILLALKHRQIPPAVHYTKTNANIAMEGSPFYVNTALEEWPAAPGGRRSAAISSFGASGTNAHMVIEEAPLRAAAHRPRQPRLIVLSARSSGQLRQLARQLAHYCEQHPDADVADISYTLLQGRKHCSQRLALAVEDAGQLAQGLARWLDGGTAPVLADGGPALEALARQFTQGAAIDTDALFGDGGYRRAALPTYPFEQESYWLPGSTPPARPAAAAAAATAVTVRSAGNWRHSRTLDGQEFFLRDHRVQGHAILPGAVYLELAHAAQCAAAGSGAPAFAGFRNIVLLRPVAVGERSLAIHTELHQAEGARFEIYSEASEAGGARQVHCQGELGAAPAAASAPLDLSRLRARHSLQAIGPAEFYAQYAAIGIQYGPAFQGFSQAYTAPGSVLARLVLPAAMQPGMAQHAFHPVLIDCAFQCLKLLSAEPSQRGQAQLLFAIQEARLEAPFAAEMWAWIRFADPAFAAGAAAAIDIDLVDGRGTLCLALKGIRTRPAGGARPAARAPQRQPAVTLLPAWEAESAGEGLAWPAPAAAVGIVGASAQMQAYWRRHYPAASIIDLPSGASVDEIAARLQACGELDHVFWTGPDPAQQPPSADELIAGQQLGTLALFRLLKGLLKAGYGRRSFGLSCITQGVHAVRAGETADATHAGISGLLGTLAKEYPNWQVRGADLPAGDAQALQAVLTLGPEADGNTRVYRHGQWHSQRLLPVRMAAGAGTRFRTGGVYVIAGGAGGLGRAISAYLIRRYQARVVWLGRRAPDAAMEADIAILSADGPAPLYLQVDAADGDAVRRAHAEIRRRCGLVNGLIQSALVFAGASLERMSEEQFHTVLRAKVDVSAHLAAELGGAALDFVLCISSINSYLKAMGQCNYAAGCTFMDAFAQQLAQRQAGAKVINLGYCFNNAVDSPDRNGGKAMDFIEREELMDGIETLLASDLAQMTLMKFSPALNTRGIVLGEGSAALLEGEAMPSCVAALMQPGGAGPGDLESIKARMRALNALVI